jgi:heme/copper-type cytochrome/quinol oxidase subunit 2
MNAIGTHHDGGHGASAAFGFGTALIFFGALGMLVESSDHSACSTAWAAGVQQCESINEIWTLGIIALVVGVVLIIVGAILRTK